MKKILLLIILNWMGCSIVNAQFSNKYNDFLSSYFNEYTTTSLNYSDNFIKDSLVGAPARFGVGYSASIGLLASLKLYTSLRVPPMSYELSYSFVFLLKKDTKGYEGLNLKVIRQFSKKTKVSFYYFGAIYFSKGSEVPLNLFHFEGDFYLGLDAGLGLEGYNGYFIEVGNLYLDKAFLPYLGAGKRYYF